MKFSVPAFELQVLQFHLKAYESVLLVQFSVSALELQFHLKAYKVCATGEIFSAGIGAAGGIVLFLRDNWLPNKVMGNSYCKR